jgi:SAM-dependent methyltransferase
MLRHKVSDHTPKTVNSWLKDGDKVLSDIVDFNFHHSYVSYLPRVKEIFLSAETVNQTNYWDSYNKTQYLSEEKILTSIENKKDKPVCDYIKQNKPRTMVDLGCNSGRHSLYAALQGVKCVGLDNAAKTVDEANKAAAALDLTCSFAFLDLFKSDVKLGLRETPHKRFKSDMAIAPALIHHMFISSRNIEKCIGIICEYAHKNVAIEFIPHTDPAISRSIGDWFGIEDAICAIDNNGFKIENIVDSNTSGRKWIFAQKNEKNMD